MPEPIEKPPCARCNPLPSPAITIDECPDCEQETRRRILETMQEHRRLAKLDAEIGIIALERLLPVLSGRSGQSYKVRGILYSLWNGQPFSWLEFVGLDRSIKQDLAVVLIGWGAPGFFYDEMRRGIVSAGQWAWFLEEAENIDPMRGYVESFDTRKLFEKEEAR